MGAFASAFATPTCMGNHKSLEVGGALVEVEVAEVGAPGGKKVTRSLLRYECLCSFPCPLFALRMSRDKLIFQN